MNTVKMGTVPSLSDKYSNIKYRTIVAVRLWAAYYDRVDLSCVLGQTQKCSEEGGNRLTVVFEHPDCRS